MPQSFFQAHLGGWVLRRDGADDSFRTYQLVENPKAVLYYHALQEMGVEFKPILTIHSSPIDCEACSS